MDIQNYIRCMVAYSSVILVFSVALACSLAMELSVWRTGKFPSLP